MTRKFTLLTAGLWLLLGVSLAKAQTVPSVSPTASCTDADGNTEEGESYSGSAPISVKLTMNPTDNDGWTAHYEWRFYHDSDTTAYTVRYEEDTEYTLHETGRHRIVAYARFTQDDQVVEYNNEESPFTVEVSESQLRKPNAYSPNGDGINDIYMAKSGFRSIEEFHATIFNRWGKKLYEWDNPAEGWDGTYQGKNVKQGVYFVLVKARGADGKDYVIKRDVNLLRGYTEGNETD